LLDADPVPFSRNDGRHRWGAETPSMTVVISSGRGFRFAGSRLEDESNAVTIARLWQKGGI